MNEEVLRLSHLGIAAGGTPLFEDLSFSVRLGEIVCFPCLSAEQRGALCRVLSGRLRPAEGWIFIDSVPVTLASPVEAARRGVFCILKESALFRNLSIPENLFAHPARGRGLLLHRARITDAARRLLETYAPEIPADADVAALGAFERRLLELVKAVHAGARVIVFDHDLGGDTEAEAARLGSLFRQLTAQGVAIVCMSANLGRAMRVADRIVAVRQKTALMAFERPFSAGQIGNCLLGGAGPWDGAPAPVVAGPCLLSVTRMRVPSQERPFDLELRAGEIIGLADVTHRFADEILLALAGSCAHREASLTLCGAPNEVRSREESFRGGVLLAEDLSSDKALFRSMTVAENIMLPALRRSAGAFCRLRRRFLSAEAREAAAALGLTEEEFRAPPTKRQAFRTQLARIRLSYCRVLLLRAPFSGLRAGEQRTLRRFLLDFAAEGNGVLISAADAGDLAGLCTRVYLAEPDGLRERSTPHFTEEAGHA